MRYENIYSSFPCPASGHFSAASRRVAPISASVWCLRLVVAFLCSVLSALQYAFDVVQLVECFERCEVVDVET